MILVLEMENAPVESVCVIEHIMEITASLKVSTVYIHTCSMTELPELNVH